VLEVVERPEAGPEVVQRQPAATLRHPLRELPGRGHVGDRRRLGDLQDEGVGVHGARGEGVDDHLLDLLVADRVTGQVHRQPELGDHLLQPRHDRHRAADDPGVQRWHQPAPLGDVEEPGRRHQLVAVTQPQQRLGAGDEPGLQVAHRLEEQLEAVLLERALDPGLPRQPGPGSRQPGRLLLEDRDPVAARLLGVVHRHVGERERVVLPGPGRPERHHAHARGDTTPNAVQARGVLVDPLHDGARDRHGAPAVGVPEQYRELVATEPGHHVGGPDPLAEDPRRGDEELVSRVVAQRVVDLLEVVQVEQEQRAVRAVALAVVEVSCQLGVEAAPVGQPGQDVVVRQVRQPRLVAATLRHVDHVDQDPVVGAVVLRDHPAGDRRADVVALPVAEGGVRRDRTSPGCADRGQVLLELVALGAEQVERPALDLLPGTTEHREQRGVGALHGAVRGQHDDAVRGVGEESLDPPVRVHQRELALARPAHVARYHEGRTSLVARHRADGHLVELAVGDVGELHVRRLAVEGLPDQPPERVLVLGTDAREGPVRERLQLAAVDPLPRGSGDAAVVTHDQDGRVRQVVQQRPCLGLGQRQPFDHVLHHRRDQRREERPEHGPRPLLGGVVVGRAEDQQRAGQHDGGEEAADDEVAPQPGEGQPEHRQSHEDRHAGLGPPGDVAGERDRRKHEVRRNRVQPRPGGAPHDDGQDERVDHDHRQQRQVSPVEALEPRHDRAQHAGRRGHRERDGQPHGRPPPPDHLVDRTSLLHEREG